MVPTLCSGPASRREFLRAGTLAMGGLSLAEILAARADAGQGGTPETSVILFWMWGGPSQLETWDMKPQAPSEYRGPFVPIQTNVPGIEICELFPRHAKVADRFSIIRSLHHEQAQHNDGSIEVLTGKTPLQVDPTSRATSEHPDFGMFASRIRGRHPGGLPQYVGVPTQPFMTRPVYLGMNHSAFNTGNPALADFRPPNLIMNGGINGGRLDDRRGLIKQLDRLRRDIDLNGSLDGIDQFRQQAFQLLTSDQVAKAFDLQQESPELRDRYGRTMWGQSCLLARRLAEAGTAVVTIEAMEPELGSPLYHSWDDHAGAKPGWDLARGMIWRAQHMDRALATLIEDIYERNLDRRILVVALGEFGRAPRLDHYIGCIGRNHWPQAQSALVSGGGMRMGQIIGATTSKSEYPTERPLTPQDLLATIYRHLGIDQHTEFPDFSGRPHPVLKVGEPIRELV